MWPEVSLGGALKQNWGVCMKSVSLLEGGKVRVVQEGRPWGPLVG